MVVKLYSFGYYGWGNHTPHLLEAVAAVEAARGYVPPGFVDTRIRRAVRAKGFQGAAFERLLGATRHRWMPSLGNRSVVTGTGPEIQIAEPEAAADLLELALEAAAERRHLLFFCACAFPREDGKTSCHRDTIGDLVLAEAQKRGEEVEVVEWPGGEPAALALDFEPGLLRAVERERATIPLGEPADLAALCALPWGSTVTLRSAGREARVLSGPARYHYSGWVLPVLELLNPGLPDDAVATRAAAVREGWGLQPRR
jgi:hypothetical protein